MPAAADRLDLRLRSSGKDRLRRAAALARPPQAPLGSLAARLRGRATACLSTDEIMPLIRGA